MTKLQNRMKLFLILLLIGAFVLGMSACDNSEPSEPTEPRTYTVTFMVDGVEFAKVTADWDKPITFPAAPQKQGYTFAGWYDGDTQVSEIKQGSKEAVTLTAKWKPTEYTIAYELGGGTNDVANPTSYTVESGSIALAQPQKYGYAFTGWFYGETQVDAIDPAWNCDVTLTAKWQIDPDSTCFTYGDNYVITGLKDETAQDIVIPDYVTGIADMAFALTGVQTLQFAQGSTCKSIGQYAFQGCEALTSVEIPASIEDIGICAFYMCTSLQTVEFAEDSKLERIRGGVFNDCYGIVSMHVPASVVEIEDSAISGCIALEQITFAKDSKLQRIGDFNFVQSKALQSIVIPAGVIYIGQTAEYTLAEIYYVGNATDWSMIAGAANFAKDATVYAYSESQPAQAGNYWYYDGDTIVKW